MFTQKTTNVRQSNTSARFTGFGQAIRLGKLCGTSALRFTAPREIPAGTEVAIIAEVATADHFNLFLVACKLPDGSVKGMALRPKPLAKLKAILDTTAPAPEVSEDAGEETPSEPEPAKAQPKAEPKAKKPRKSRAKKPAKPVEPAPVVDLDDAIAADDEDAEEGPTMADLDAIEMGEEDDFLAA
jgi:hypothetical protein